MSIFNEWKKRTREELKVLLLEGKIDPAISDIVRRLNQLSFITVDTCSAHLENGRIVNSYHFREFSDQPPAANVCWVADKLANPAEISLAQEITEQVVGELEAVNEGCGDLLIKPYIHEWTDSTGLRTKALLIWFHKPNLGFELLSEVWTVVEQVLAKHDGKKGTQFAPEMFTLQPG